MTEDQRYLEMLESLIANYFDSKKDFAELIGIAPGSLSRVLSGKQKSVSDAFKDKVYMSIKNNLEIPKDIRDFFQTDRVDDVGEIVTKKDSIGLLIQKITKQLYENQNILKDKDEIGLYDVYNALYEFLDALNYKIGAIDKYRLEGLYSQSARNIWDLLWMSGFNHKHTVVNYDHFYDIYNHLSSFNSKLHSDFSYVFRMPNCSLGNIMPLFSILFVKNISFTFETDENGNVTIDSISKVISREIELMHELFKNKNIEDRTPVGLFQVYVHQLQQYLTMPMLIDYEKENSVYGEKYGKYEYYLSVGQAMNVSDRINQSLLFKRRIKLSNETIKFLGLIYKMNEVNIQL